MEQSTIRRVAAGRQNGGVLLRILAVFIFFGAIAYVVTAPPAKNFLLSSYHDISRSLASDQNRAVAGSSAQKPEPQATPSEQTSEASQVQATASEPAAQPTSEPEKQAAAEPLPAAPASTDVGLDDISSRPETWPETTALTKDTVFPLFSGGKQVGGVKFRVGKEFKVQALEGQSVVVDYMGNRTSVPVDSTDFLERAKAKLGSTRLASSEPASTSTDASATAPSAEEAPVPRSQDMVETPLFNWLKDNIVSLHGDAVEPCGAQALAGVRYLALYFAEGADGASHRLTPQLIEFYQSKKAKGVPLEFVFVSQDTQQAAMENFMREVHMPWPALKWEQTNLQNELTLFAGGQKPSLVLIDANGKLLASSNKNGTYFGPSPVLEAIEKLK